MKHKYVFIAIIGLFFFTSACKKEGVQFARVRVQIDYLGAGGYYNDNIAGVPTGLTIGSNGPFNVSADKQYTMTYRANSNFPDVSITNWTPTTSGTWVIHCYITDDNLEHIETYSE